MRLFSSAVKAVANFEASPKSFSAAFLAFPAGRAMRAFRSNGWRSDGMRASSGIHLNFKSWEEDGFKVLKSWEERGFKLQKWPKWPPQEMPTHRKGEIFL